MRALEPLEGLESMAGRRGTDEPRALCSGPGKLVQALGILPEDDGRSLLDGRLRVLPRESRRRGTVCAGPRIGISKATDEPLRFWLEGNPFVSR